MGEFNHLHCYAIFMVLFGIVCQIQDCPEGRYPCVDGEKCIIAKYKCDGSLPVWLIRPLLEQSLEFQLGDNDNSKSANKCCSLSSAPWVQVNPYSMCQPSPIPLFSCEMVEIAANIHPRHRSLSSRMLLSKINQWCSLNQSVNIFLSIALFEHITNIPSANCLSHSANQLWYDCNAANIHLNHRRMREVFWALGCSSKR